MFGTCSRRTAKAHKMSSFGQHIDCRRRRVCLTENLLNQWGLNQLNLIVWIKRHILSHATAFIVYCIRNSNLQTLCGSASEFLTVPYQLNMCTSLRLSAKCVDKANSIWCFWIMMRHCTQVHVPFFAYKRKKIIEGNVIKPNTTFDSISIEVANIFEYFLMRWHTHKMPALARASTSEIFGIYNIG